LSRLILGLSVAMPCNMQTALAGLLICIFLLDSALCSPDAILHAPLRLRGGFFGRGGSKSLRKFDPSLAEARVQRVWELAAEYGIEKDPFTVYSKEIVRDRFALVQGIQMLRDELQLQSAGRCSADLSIPTALSTCAYTLCGDRMCQSRSLTTYINAVAARFASLHERGDPKPELFFATGGGTDSGPTLAHVTVAHSIDAKIKGQLYNGNAKSYVLVNIDICTHCGHLDIGKNNSGYLLGKKFENVGVIYGSAQESVFRDPRNACFSIIGCLSRFNLASAIHVRLRNDLGEANYQFLSKHEVLADDGSPITYLIASCIVAIRGMMNTLEALGPGCELDERGVGHCTAQVQMNHGDQQEYILYCARGTVFNGEMRVQGLGLDATKYSGRILRAADGSKRCELSYNGIPASSGHLLPVRVKKYGQDEEEKERSVGEREERLSRRDASGNSAASSVIGRLHGAMENPVGSDSLLTAIGPDGKPPPASSALEFRPESKLPRVNSQEIPFGTGEGEKLNLLEKQLGDIRTELKEGWHQLQNAIGDIMNLMQGV